MLRVTATKRLRSFTVDVDLTVQRGITVMLGPSGHGKTSVLNMIAGRLKPDRGRITVDDTVLFDTDARLDVAMEQRSVGYVFQDYALFPHLSVFGNVAFGLRSKHMPDAAARTRVMEMLERLSISQLKNEPPRKLSAGQRQRVALARALVVEPRVMLMDEPLGALDMQLRSRVRADLKAILRTLDIPTILVTHDPMDAIGLAGTVVVMEQGRVIQKGTYDTLLASPASRFVAEFVEANAYMGELVSADADGDAVIRLDEGVNIFAALNEPSQRMLVVIHPWDVALMKKPNAGSMRNVIRGRVASICPLRDRVRVMIQGPMPITAEITRPSLDHLELQEGGTVYAAFKTTAVRVFPTDQTETETTAGEHRHVASQAQV